jgi:hypothetical protein
MLSSFGAEVMGRAPRADEAGAIYHIDDAYLNCQGGTQIKQAAAWKEERLSLGLLSFQVAAYVA